MPCLHSQVDRWRTVSKQSHMIPVKIEAEMKKSYLDYAMSVIVAHAPFPMCATAKTRAAASSVAMNDLGLASIAAATAMRKSAAIPPLMHPHGEAVIYHWLRASRNPSTAVTR